MMQKIYSVKSGNHFAGI